MNDLLDVLAKPPPPPSELDELMSRDPLDLSAADIDSIIALQRQARARREAGGPKAKRATKDSPASGINLAELMAAAQPAKPKPVVVPVVGAKPSGLRRL